jgi:hypothetical protein
MQNQVIWYVYQQRPVTICILCYASGIRDPEDPVFARPTDPASLRATLVRRVGKLGVLGFVQRDSASLS